MNPIWYPCPVCGAENASDGYSFCGPCQQEYAESQEDERAETERERNRGELI